MPYNYEGSDLLQLVPKGLGFTDHLPQMSVEQMVQIFQEKLSDESLKKLNQLFQHSTSDETLKEILNEFPNTLAAERRRLFEMCGYTVHRCSDIEDTMYLKALFVIRNHNSLKNNYSTSKFRAVLAILLSDSGVLFTDTDEKYRHHRINDEGISAWKPLFYDPKRREDYCSRQATNISKQFREEDRHLYETILNEISKSAIRKHQNICSWVKNHLPYDDSDIDKNLVQLKEAFPEYADQITLSFSENFYLLALPPYASKVAMLSNNELRPSCLPVSVEQEAAQLFVYYKARLQRFENLRSKACEQEKFLKPIMAFSKFRAFLISTTSEECVAHIEHVAEICAAIRYFFIQCHSPLKEDSKGTLQQRVVWAMSQTSIPNNLGPVFLVYMTICCNRNVALSGECSVQSPPVFDPRYSKRKQRYFQLVLLNRLCDILSASKNNRMENWKQYLALQGTEILSVEEARFWKHQLGTEYEQFPVIGFQLCCTDYIEECMPLHLDYLSYDGGSLLQRGGYHDFWEQNQEYIRFQADDLKKRHPQILKQYKKFWNKPKDYYFRNKKWFQEILEHAISVDLSKFVEAPVCNEDELQRLVLETELQLCLICDARSKLQKMCVDVYSIKKDIFKSFN